MTTTRDEYPEVLDSQLHWQQAQVAVYTRDNGQHISYVVWLDDTQPEKPAQLLDLKAADIVALADIDTAKARVADAEQQAGRAVPVDDGGVL